MAGTIASLRMRFGPQEMFDDGTRVHPDRGSPLDQPLRRPFGVREVRFRHVLAQRRMRAALIRAHVARDSVPAPEKLAH
jgi:hypothetical protein